MLPQWLDLSREQLRARQRERLNALLEQILPQNRFYQRKLAGRPTRLEHIDQLAAWPTTVKEELLPKDDDPFYLARNHTWEPDRYVRFHQTSGSRGRALRILDTDADWQWWIEAWQWVLDAAEVTARDRALLAFSFGPFVGFWSAFDALAHRGVLVVPGGGMSTEARLHLLAQSQATLVLCTPTYALRMAEVARQIDFPLAEQPVRGLIVAGEPGGSLAEVRQRIEQAWNATVYDHAGATELGPWGIPHPRGLLVNEALYVAEFLDLESGRVVEPQGQLCQLVLTNLGRPGCPLLRYETGDLVRPRPWPERGFVLLEGGVLGRTDDMVTVRGVNVYPSAVESVVRSFPELGEFRIILFRQGELDQLKLVVEDPRNDPARLARELQLRLGLSVQVESVPPGSLERFELKARRVIDRRKESPGS